MTLAGFLRWVGLALLGLAVAAAVSVAAARLTRQHIGLANEPISAGRSLAPPRSGASAGPKSHTDTSPGAHGDEPDTSPGSGQVGAGSANPPQSITAPVTGVSSGGDEGDGGADD